MWQSVRRSVTALVVATVAPMALQAQAVTFSSFADFQAAVGVIGTDNFDNLTAGQVVAPTARLAGSFSYTAASGAGDPLSALFALSNPSAPTDMWLSEENVGTGIVFSGFGTDVRAIGGNFFTTDEFGGPDVVSLMFRAIDVTGVTYENMVLPSAVDGFFGVKFDNALLSLEILTDGNAFVFATVNNLVLGSAATSVPEPSTVFLMAVGGIMLAAAARRRNARV